METTGALSGSRPSSRRLSGVAAQARPGSSMRATTRTTISLAALMSDLPSPGSTVERAAYFTSASDRARAMRTRDGAAAVEPRHHRPHRHLEGGRDVSVRHLLGVEQNDRLPRPLVQIGESSIESRELLPKRGLPFRAWRQLVADRHRFDPRGHLSPPQEVQAEPARDRDEPRQDRPLRIESLAMDEGPYERVLRQVLGVGGSEQSPADNQAGPMEAE